MKSTNIYREKTIQLATMLDAMAHPARLQILFHLSKYKNSTAGNIASQLPISKSTVSKHLSKLKEIGLITCTPKGVCLNYQINDELLAHVKEHFNNFIKQMEMNKAKRKECSTVI